jgi:hypothetical protein
LNRPELLLLFGLGLYLAECGLWVKPGELLFLTWFRRFSLIQGPALRFRNPWPLGFTSRFPTPVPGVSILLAPASLSLKDAQNRWNEFQKATRVLNWLPQGLLLVILDALVLYFIRRGFPLAWAILFFIFLALHFSITATFWRAHRALYPSARQARIKKTLLCLVSPWQSSRAAGLLGDGLLNGFHPLVAAKLFLDEAAFLKLTRGWLLRLRYPAIVHREVDQARWLAPDSAGEEKALVEWMKGLGLNTAELLKPPLASGPTHLSYCQRCDIEYVIAEGRCGDCGRELVPFARKP